MFEEVLIILNRIWTQSFGKYYWNVRGAGNTLLGEMFKTREKLFQLIINLYLLLQNKIVSYSLEINASIKMIPILSANVLWTEWKKKWRGLGRECLEIVRLMLLNTFKRIAYMKFRDFLLEHSILYRINIICFSAKYEKTIHKWTVCSNVYGIM